VREVFRVLEPQPADGILDIELGLEVERDRLRTSDDGQVVWKKAWIGRPGKGAEPVQQIPLGLPGTKGDLTVGRTSLLPTPRQEGLEGLHDLWRDVLGE
jgi:hypothetical protein